ncbi:hypothetical protein GC170_15040 [bacterium]|nr:hypothetical protein [bacterium]
MKIESREYKLLIDHSLFRHRSEAVNEIWREIRHAAKDLPAVRIKGELKLAGTRMARFLDTPDFTFRRNGLLLRQRWGEGSSELTLKCRSEDLFLAFGTDVTPAKGLAGKAKFEEDIAPPFLSRFSHSATVAGLVSDKPGKPPKAPATVADAEEVFPVIGTLSSDERTLHGKIEIRTVQGIEVKETVWTSDTIEIRVDDESKPLKASFAAILWTRGPSETPVIAELSFKIRTLDGYLSRSAAAGARSLHRALQGLDSYRSDARTKTEYVYRDGGRD